MNKKNILQLTIALFFSTSISIIAQHEFPPLSHMGKIYQVVGDTKVEIEYERPSVRNRKIFGGLVPWNKVWRTGAGYCTKISFDKSVKVGGQQIDKGRYSLFTIPNKEEWVIIFNRDTTLYGSYNYDPALDVARFSSKSTPSNRRYETLTFDIDLVPNNAIVYINWVNTQVAFRIDTNIDAVTLKYIEQLLIADKINDLDEYGLGADYLLYQNMNYNDGLLLADKMIQEGGNIGWAQNIKVGIYRKTHRYDLALIEIEKSVARTNLMKYEKEEYRINDLEELERQKKEVAHLIFEAQRGN